MSRASRRPQSSERHHVGGRLYEGLGVTVCVQSGSQRISLTGQDTLRSGVRTQDSEPGPLSDHLGFPSPR